MKMEMLPTEFINAGPATPQFDALIHECIRTKNALSVDLSKLPFEVCVQSGTDNIETLQVEFQSVAGLDVQSCKDFRGRILFPIVFNMLRIIVPHQQIYTVRRDQRSPADACLRNIFFAISRPGSAGLLFSLEETPSRDFCTELQKRYIYLIKALFDEPAFDRADLMERIYINAHLKTLEFGNSLLDRGLECLRDETWEALPVCKSQQVLGQIGPILREEFLTAQRKMMKLYSC